MLCESFQKLSTYEKFIFIGELNHVVMNSEEAFKEASELVNKEIERGTLERVKILPESKIEY